MKQDVLDLINEYIDSVEHNFPLTHDDEVKLDILNNLLIDIKSISKEVGCLGFTPEEIAYMAKFFKERTSAEYIANDMRIVAKLLDTERKEAHWIEHKRAEEDNWLLVSNYECSNCHTWKRENSDYCPDCGCKMAIL